MTGETPEHLVENLHLRSGPKGSATGLSFHPTSVNVFVGPNHSGKSLLLREIQAAIQHPEQAPHWKVLQDLKFKPWSDATKVTLIHELRASTRASLENPITNVELVRGNLKIGFNREHFESLLVQLPLLNDVGEDKYLRPYFLAGSFLMLGGAERLNMLADSKRERPPGNECVHLLSRLFYSDEKRRITQTS